MVDEEETERCARNTFKSTGGSSGLFLASVSVLRLRANGEWTGSGGEHE